jgi:hydrogenase maturation protease
MGAPDRPARPGVTVLGIGNPIMSDDGVGIVLLEALMAADLERTVEFIDGGTIGMSLLPVVADAGSLLVLDAVADTATAATVVHLVGDQLPRLIRGKVSPHQVGLLDVLAAARLLGTEPDRIAVVGITPECVEMGVGLSAGVAAAVPAALSLARRVLREWWAADDAGPELGAQASAQGWSGTSSST